MIRIGSISFFFLYRITITILFLHDENLEARIENSSNYKAYEFIILTIEFVFSGYTKVYFIHILNISVIVWLNVSSESC